MNGQSLKDDIIHELDKLSETQLREILSHTLRLQSKLPPGTSGEVLLEHARNIKFDSEDLAEMMRAIEEDCERIDWESWE